MKALFTPERKKVIFLDMNNTLVDDRQSFNQCFVAVLHDFTARWDWNEHPLDPQQVLEQYNELWAKQRRTIRSTDKGAMNALRQKCLVRALKPYTDGLQERFGETFFRLVQEKKPLYAQPVPGMLQSINELAQTYRLAVISNSSEAKVFSYAHKLGLSPLIKEEHLFTTEHRSEKKPNRIIFERAMNKMKVQAAECVMIGNSWRNDIQGAAAVKMDSVWLRAKNDPQPSVRQIGKCKIALIREAKQLLDVFALADG